MKALADGLGRWLDARFVTLGADGFGRSDTREALRDFFEVDARFITLATFEALARDGAAAPEVAARALADLGIDHPDKPDPAAR